MCALCRIIAVLFRFEFTSPFETLLSAVRGVSLGYVMMICIVLCCEGRPKRTERSTLPAPREAGEASRAQFPGIVHADLPNQRRNRFTLLIQVGFPRENRRPTSRLSRLLVCGGEALR